MEFHYPNNKLYSDTEFMSDWIDTMDNDPPTTDEYNNGDWYCDTITDIAREVVRQIKAEERGECKIVHDTYGDWHCYENGESEYISIGD